MRKRGTRDRSFLYALSPLIVPILAGLMYSHQWFRENTHVVDLLGNDIVAVPEINSDKVTLRKLLMAPQENTITITPLTLYERDLRIQVPRSYMNRRSPNSLSLLCILTGDFDGDGHNDDLQIGSSFPVARMRRGFVPSQTYYNVLD